MAKHLGGRGRQISEFEASLVYRVSTRTARATQRNPVSKNQKTNKQKTKNKNKNNKKRIIRRKQSTKDTSLCRGCLTPLCPLLVINSPAGRFLIYIEVDQSDFSSNISLQLVYLHYLAA